MGMDVGVSLSVPPKKVLQPALILTVCAWLMKAPTSMLTNSKVRKYALVDGAPFAVCV